ncbi:ATP-binding protein [Candidatus Thiothrix sp. Deng01]|uniref:histidine kinase n=1 Tax=Candidatus Thiothrix phosphatis TaxID=3112415 RepID=A0ABU6D147_9GAMM|nr:ATP-binding protein [Candidatus Thiothrix sp. Deng01]MEB4592795.1 ATP-binding protein [Candidatus Thiothrix sp. Deng01]
MLSSLRSRQLISGFGVIMVGILMLGSMLHWFSYRYKIDQEKSELTEISYNILGFLSFEDGKFDVLKDSDMQEKAKQMIEDYDLNDVEQNRFAYVIDTATSDIIWSASSFGKPSNLVDPDYYLYFNLGRDQEASFKPFFAQLKPRAPQDPSILDSDPTIKQKYNQEYLLAAQNFFQDPYGHFQFIVGESIADIDKEMQDMRQKFAILLFLSAVLVLIAQLALSFWVVAPIKEFENEVKSIEAGERESIDDHYPEELIPVKNALNGLLSYEKGQKQRYKDSLDDLAHSLKTPLAAMQNQLDLLAREFIDESPASTSIKVFDAQIARMREIISHQLRRAMVTNQGAMILSQPLRPVLFRLRDTLQKVYRDKPFEFRINVDEYAKCRMDAEDMMELLGNLVNNACRFCQDIVEISAYHEGNMLVVDIDDDGMGFPTDNPAKLLQRGIREDSKSEGQGIGMAVSTEIVSAIGGKIELLVSPYVGARVRLHLPV